ncbi:MAG: methyltransferase domain-containing protein [Anaerolineales bacterium]|nr:methyltransferase domain-containing protein [Anaerolineales bacterium]
MEEVASCPLCGHSHRKIFDQRTFREQRVVNQLCTNCGFVYQSPRMTEAELSEFYEAEYRTLYQGDEGPSRKDLVVQAGRAESLIGILETNGVQPARALDIGSSAGTLLLRIKDRYDAVVAGIEPGAAYRAYAENQAITIYSSLEDMAGFRELPFDLITMAHVLEHLPDPAGYLANLRENHLAPGGSLLVEVPNLYAHDSFEIAHLGAYSKHTLQEMLRKAGYSVLDLKAHGQPRSVVLPLYLAALARPMNRPPGPETYTPRPESGVPRKRRWGLRRRRFLERLFPDLAWLATP